MELIFLFFVNDVLLVLLYLVYHKRNIKKTTAAELPLYRSEKIEIKDETLKKEYIKNLSAKKMSVNKNRLKEKKNER